MKFPISFGLSIVFLDIPLNPCYDQDPVLNIRTHFYSFVALLISVYFQRSKVILTALFVYGDQLHTESDTKRTRSVLQEFLNDRHIQRFELFGMIKYLFNLDLYLIFNYHDQ